MRKSAYLFLVFLLVGCAEAWKPQLACDELTTLRSLVGQEYTPDELRAWVSEAYQPPSEWLRTEKYEESQEVNWRKGSIWYTATLQQSKVVRVVAISGRISISDLTKCIGGEPSWYSAQYGPHWSGNMLMFDLLFPEQGVLAGGTRFLRSRPERPPAINGNYRMTYVSFVSPGSLDQIMSQIYGPGPSVEREQEVQKLKPWPGEWKDIVIDEIPDPEY